MKKLEEVARPLEFPVLIWTEGFLRVSEEPTNLFVVSRAGAKEMASQKPGEFHVLDANGRRFEIIGWERIEPFGGFETLFERLFQYVFQVPILANERQLSLEETKSTIRAAALSRYQHDIEPCAMADIEKGLSKARSQREAIQVVRHAVEPA